MGSKKALIWPILVVAVVALGVFYYATTRVINPAFTTIENRDVRQNTGRAVDALQARVDNLEFKATDWSAWDDTYLFVENHNAAYVKSNLQDNSLQNLGINVMLFYNEKQQLVYAKGIDDSGSNSNVSPTLTASFKPGSKFLAKDVDSESKGILTLPDSTFQFVAMPILDSNGNGPLHGTLVFGSYLTPNEVSSLSAVTHLNVSYWRYNDPARPADITKTIGNTPRTIIEVNAASADKIYGYQTINDVAGQPALIARVEMPREIHQVAQSALQQYLLIVILDTFFAIFMILLLMRIVSRQDQVITLKNEFFSMASHELRTPLTVIRDYNQLMKFKFAKQINDPEFEKMTDNVDRTSAQLIGLVNTFMDAARLERGTIPYNIEAFSLHDLCDSMLTELTVHAQGQGLTLSADCPRTLPPIKADKMRVQQVITNLVGNAMKFTEHGSITIKAVPRNNAVVVYVSDTGRGMDKTGQKTLFQRFKQVKKGDAVHGSGLGLFISKKLIEQMGGTIELESSEVGRGTTLSFTLPAAAPMSSTPTLAA